MLYSPRPDWPEEPWLSDWLEHHATALALPRDRLWAGDFGEPLRELLARPVSPRLEPTGIAAAVDLLTSLLA